MTTSRVPLSCLGILPPRPPTRRGQWRAVAAGRGEAVLVPEEDSEVAVPSSGGVMKPPYMSAWPRGSLQRMARTRCAVGSLHGSSPTIADRDSGQVGAPSTTIRKGSPAV